MLGLALLCQDTDGRKPDEEVRAAGRVAGLEFSDEQLLLMESNVAEARADSASLAKEPLNNGVAPVTRFTPLIAGVEGWVETLEPVGRVLPDVERPADLEELAFADIPTLASLIKGRKVSCLELTEMFLGRLERLDGTLHCVITMCPERARAQAKALDAELEAGNWRGMLHGIPWGAKDLLATRGIRTTWGAKPFEHQMLDFDATVVERLDAAGAVLIAKLSLGALAWGDVWFGERTRNPWDPTQGSSGSSAGSASASAAGAVPFAIGSETLGSIVSPSVRCGNSSLRPTFGRVSRHGAMALSWSMDKLGPLCRSATDAAIVFSAIQGGDAKDDHSIDWPHRDLGAVSVSGWRVGMPRGAFENDFYAPFLDELRALGVELVEVDLPEVSPNALGGILSVEAAAAFDELTRSGRDGELVRQVRDAWPNVFRAAHLVSAVDYVQMNRKRRELMLAWSEFMGTVDILVHPPYHGSTLLSFNLTGHPTFVAPYRMGRRGSPTTVAFSGQLFGDERLLALVEAWQASTDYHHAHPDLD